MALNIPLPSVEGTDILDALNKYAQLHQARVSSQFAQPNAQANLDKLKALIQGQNLENQVSQIKMPFVAPKEKAGLNKLLADIAHTQTETSYIPTKYSQAAERLGIEQRRFSPEQLNTLQKYREALIENMPKKNLTSFGKEALEQANLEKGLLPTGKEGMIGAPQEGGQISPQQQQLINQYKLHRIKQTTDSALRAAFPQIESIDKTMASIPFETVSKFYGPEGQLKASVAYANSARGKLDPEYKQYKDFLTVKGPSLVAQMRQFLKDSVTPGAQEHIRGIVFPKKWTDNPTLALNQFNTLKDLYNIEKQARVRAGNDPTLFEGKESEPVKQESYKAPTFNNEQDFKRWKASATPAEISAYRQHLGV